MGPILFMIYINDLLQWQMKSSIGMYADDTVIYFSATSPGLIKQVPNNVEQWLQENKLVLSQSKTKWILFGTISWAKNWKSIKFLLLRGYVVWASLMERAHVAIISHKVSKCLGLPNRIWPWLTQKGAKCVFNCLIQPMFNYTDTVWGGLSIGCGKNLQRLQNRAAHIVQGRSTTDEAFQMLGWINLETCTSVFLVYKCLNNLATPYFLRFFHKK